MTIEECVTKYWPECKAFRIEESGWRVFQWADIVIIIRYCENDFTAWQEHIDIYASFAAMYWTNKARSLTEIDDVANAFKAADAWSELAKGV